MLYELFHMIDDSDFADDEVDVTKLPHMIAWQLEEAGGVEKEICSIPGQNCLDHKYLQIV